MLLFSLHRIRYNVGEKKNPSAQARLTGVYMWAEVCHRCVFSARPVEFFHLAFLMKSDSFLREGNCERITQIKVTPWTTDTPWTCAQVRLVPDLCSKVRPKKTQGAQVTGSDKISTVRSGATSGKIYDHAHKIIAMIIISMKQTALSLLIVAI